MVDAVRLLSAGYSTRLPFDTLEQMFKPLAPAKFQKLPPHIFCVALLSAFDLGRSDYLLGMTKAFFKSGKLAFVDSLMSGQRTLDAAFFAKMARLLALWRLRRAISAVRVLLFLHSKMRRLRALWRFRRSASIASMIGSSWVRRAREIRFGAAIQRLQACIRGYLARRTGCDCKGAVLLLQRMLRGHLARARRDRLRIELEQVERGRKSGAKQRGGKTPDEASSVGNATGKGGGGSGKVREHKGSHHATDGAESDGNDSEGSDLVAEDSEEELEADPSKEGGGTDKDKHSANARALLDKLRRTSLAGVPGISGVSESNLGLTGAPGDEGGPGGGLKRAASSLSRLKKQSSVAGRATSLFTKARKTTEEEKRLKVSTTAKGSLVAGAVLKVSKRVDTSGGWQERFVLMVGDVVLLFVLAAQPEIPLGLRMWPERVICLSQSQLGLPGATPDVAKSGNEAAFIVQAVTPGLGAQALISDYKGTMERLAAAMHLGVRNARRSRQQAKLSHARQACHEKKLSLLKTQHMIELLYKSQETFFEAGGDQFDNCNAVCMHSGVMRQSLIDVTPFMPVSDFICEYCSQVIVLEEQATASEEAANAGDLDHEMQLRREVAKKQQINEEALMLARDVRVLRQRRRGAEEDAAGAWRAVEQAIHNRQQTELRVQELKLKQRIAGATKAELDEVRAALYAQVAAATQQCDDLAAQLEQRQTKLSGSRPPADGDS
jgi:hypothetical protein